MAFIHNLSVFSNSKSIQRFSEVHEYTFVFAGFNMESSPAASGYTWSAHLWRPKSPATTKLMLFCKTLRCLWLLFCRDDGFRAFSPFTFHYFADELRNNFMFMWYRKLCACHSRHHLNSSTVSVDMMWNNSVDFDDVRTLHLFIAKQATCRWRSTNERLLTNVRSEYSAIDRARTSSVAIWTFTTRSCSFIHWPIVVVLARSIANRSMIMFWVGRQGHKEAWVSSGTSIPHEVVNKNLCGRDGRTICGPQCVPKSTCVSL